MCLPHTQGRTPCAFMNLHLAALAPFCKRAPLVTFRTHGQLIGISACSGCRTDMSYQAPTLVYQGCDAFPPRPRVMSPMSPFPFCLVQYSHSSRPRFLIRLLP